MNKGHLLAGRFEFEALIGQGTFGEVYRGKDRKTGDVVAIKLLKENLSFSDAHLVERFRREGQVLHELQHPHIVKMLEAIEEDGRHFLVMEHIGGGSLATLLQQKPQLPLARVLEIALPLSDALIHTHRRGIIHRDIKPANVLLASDGTPYLTDFGVARISNLSPITQVGGVIGTVLYLSPEACRGEPLDERTDIWAFGIMLYEMLAGRRPFDGTQASVVITAILNDAVPSLQQFRTDLPPALISLVDEMLEKESQKRFESVHLVAMRIEKMIKTVAHSSVQIAQASNNAPVEKGGEAQTPNNVVQVERDKDGRVASTQPLESMSIRQLERSVPVSHRAATALPLQPSRQPSDARQSESVNLRSLRIYLCYSFDDRPRVRELYERLREDRFDVWLNEENLLPGQDWRHEIPKAVRTADLVIVCLSREAVDQTGSVQREIKLALNAAEEKPEGSIFIIPLKLEECDVPERLGHLQPVNLFEQRGYERLTRSLRKVAGDRGLAVVTDENLQQRHRQPRAKPAPFPAALNVLWISAQTAFRTEDWQRAEMLLSQLVELDPSYRDVHDRLSFARRRLRLEALYYEIRELRDKGEWRTVQAGLEELDSEDANYPDPEGIRQWVEVQQRRERLYEEAFAAYDKPDWFSAIATLQELLAEFPDDKDAQALFSRAEAKQQVELKHQERAEQQRREAGERIRRERLALDLIKQGNYDQALERLEQHTHQQPDDKEAAQVIADLIEDQQVPLSQRLRAAHLAAQIGDLRLGVCDLPPMMVRLKGGHFKMGSSYDEVRHAGESHLREQRGTPRDQGDPRTWSEDEINEQLITLPDFEIARYPVTNAQYQLFIEEEGYIPQKPWWDDIGRAWLQMETVKEPVYWKDPRFGRSPANCPVVGISWYEAHAFCQWLTRHAIHNPEKRIYQLPSEAEWEYAARGSERRPYPWGTAAPDVERANFNQLHGGLTPVGCFVLGATPTRIFDMAGNVWEWTRSIYRPYPFDLQRDGLLLTSVNLTKVSFAVRGGGWRSQPTLLRTSHRYHYGPQRFDNNLGFRLMRKLT